LPRTNKRGRPKVYKDPRRLEVRLSGLEYDWLQDVSQKAGTAMTLIARRALHRIGMPKVDAED
jgi:hypothetical protein